MIVFIFKEFKDMNFFFFNNLFIIIVIYLNLRSNREYTSNKVMKLIEIFCQ